MLQDVRRVEPAIGDQQVVHGVAPSARKSVFQEQWWLDAATDGVWDAVSVDRGGRVEGWLPYATTRNMGFSRCGLPPLTRLLYPVVSAWIPKDETLRRTRFQIESELIERLPRASSYEFILPPDHGNALAWQAAGFDARIQHTFIIDAGTSQADLWRQMGSKRRNLIRRAEDALKVQPLNALDFVAQYRSNLGSSVDEEHMACVGRLAEAALSRGRGCAIGAVDAQGRDHASVMFVWDERDYYYYLSTRNVAHAVLGAVSMLVWAGIADAMSRGLRFDFDGVSSQSRMHFLQSFGGRLANRIVVTRGTAAYEARLLLRRWRHRFLTRGSPERFF